MSHATLTGAELLGMFGHFLVLSLFSVGGAISAAPDMHRTLVLDHHWMDDTTFTTSIALAQAAPGPNVLFVAVLGWNAAGPMGALASMTGILLPSTVLTLYVTRWGSARRETRGVRAFTSGLTPVTIGLLFATGWAPREQAVFAGKLDYARYGVVDRLVIRLIMRLTGGPTDPSTCVDFTDWTAVEAFARRVAKLHAPSAARAGQ